MTAINPVSLACRDMRHQWQKEGDNVVLSDQGRVRHFRRRAVCLRCHTSREEEFKISYAQNNRVVAVALIRRRYGYPDGYQIRGGLKVADARAILFQDLTFVHEAD